MACTSKFVCVLVMCMAAMTSPIAEAAITCGQVTSSLVPCLPFLNGGAMSPSCCSGVRSLKAAATSTSDGRAICNCLKQAAASSPNINSDRAASLPGKCGVKLDTNTVNCAQIN